MALSKQFVDQHIHEWEDRLKGHAYPYRVAWPSRLFHHAPVENAVEILRAGQLRSRADPANPAVRDVAGAGVIDARQHAHQFARLYFRPRTPTQFHIEGIRKPHECQYGQAAHAPVLVMMVFHARQILTRPGVWFSDRNMQLGAAAPGDTEEYFHAIPFAKVYHEGGIAGDYSIIDHRCAEVLAPSPMPLEHTLEWICCRSQAEKDTLLYLLGEDAEQWEDLAIISDDLRVFQREYTFVQDIFVTPDGVLLSLNPRRDGSSIDVRVHVWDSNNRLIADFVNPELPSSPGQGKRWIFKQALEDGSYKVRVDLENHMAFLGELQLGDSLF